MTLTNSCAGVRFRTGGTKKYDRGTMKRSDFLMTVAVKSSFSKMSLFRRAPNQFSLPSDTPGHEASITAGSCLNLVHGDRPSCPGITSALRAYFRAEFTAGHFEMSLRPVNRRFSGRSDMGIETVTSRNSGFAEKVAGTSSTSLWPRSLQNHVVSSYPSRTYWYPSNKSVLRCTNSSGP